MTMPFSYRRDFFNSFLFGSFFMHAVILGANHFLVSSPPEFGVQQGVNSVDVVILEEKKEKPRIRSEQVITAKEAEAELNKNQKEETKPEEVQNPVQSNSEAKALREDDPIYLKNPAPVYPRYAQAQNWEGIVILKVLVRRDGKVAEVLIGKSSGYKILDESAAGTIRKWDFRPAGAGHLSFSSWIQIPVRFVLIDNNE